jgi:opacity protein-like surface antigen
MPIGERWSALGKLGVTSNRARFTGAGSRSDLLVGAGIGYKFSSNVGLRLEYEDFGKLSDVANVNNSRGRTLGMSVKYSF